MFNALSWAIHEILSRLAPRTTDTLFNLLRQVTTYVLLPVLVLVTRAFPEIGDRLCSSLEPIMTILQ